MELVKKLVLALLLAMGAVACSQTADCPTPVPGSIPGEIPDCILDKADQIAISRLGKAFFAKHARFEPTLSSYHEAEPTCLEVPSGCAAYLLKPYYQLAYSFTVPDLPGVVLSGGFTLDAAGNLVPEVEIDGLPDCAHGPGECSFTVLDAASAVSIARQAGLEPGLSEWRTHFHWYGGEFHTYVWTVENTLTADEFSGQSSGRSVLIDANSGSVLQIFDWEAIP